MRSWPPFPDMRTISLGIGQLRDLMAWMGHDNERAAMICQHALRDVARRAGLSRAHR
jgi:hypothetical protein